MIPTVEGDGKVMMKMMMKVNRRREQQKRKKKKKEREMEADGAVSNFRAPARPNSIGSSQIYGVPKKKTKK